jgi:hypothetical protein
MNSPARIGGVKALRFAVLVSLAGLGVAVFLIAGSYLYWQSEKSANAGSQRIVQEQRNRLEAIKRERDDLKGSEETYKSLIARGVFVPERRIDLVEALAELRKRHRLLGFEYDIFPQRTLKFGTGASYAAVDVMASRVRMKIQAYHDRDLVAFLDEFPRIQRGFFSLDKCAIKRAASAEQTAAPAATGVVEATTATTSGAPTAAIEADCTMEWITLRNKNNPGAAIRTSASAVESESRSS